MEFNLDDEWTINRALTIQEREILFLTAESAGMKIYPGARNNETIKDYPSICRASNASYDICGHTVRFSGDTDELLVEYERVIEKLKEKVKSRVI